MRLTAIIDVFRTLADDPPLRGGCPILNTAIEADDANPALRDRARAAMTEWHELIIRTATRGVAAGDLRPETDPETLATIITATIEGAVMLSRLYDDTTHMRRAVDHLLHHLSTLTLHQKAVTEL